MVVRIENLNTFKIGWVLISWKIPRKYLIIIKLNVGKNWFFKHSARIYSPDRPKKRVFYVETEAEIYFVRVIDSFSNFGTL